MAGTKKTGRRDVGKFADDNDDSDDDWKAKEGATRRTRMVTREMRMTMDLSRSVNHGQTISWILWKRANTMNEKSDIFSYS